jgi:hypothetical protein
MHADQFDVIHQVTGDDFYASAARRFRQYHARRRYRLRAFVHLASRALRDKVRQTSNAC